MPANGLTKEKNMWNGKDSEHTGKLVHAQERGSIWEISGFLFF